MSRLFRTLARLAAPLSVAGVLATTSLACGGREVVRGSQEPGIDNAAMSTGLDKEDIQRMLHENLNNLRAAPIMNQWRTQTPQATVAVFPFANTTSEHIDSQLDAILSESESWLIESQVVKVISRERQNAMIAEVEGGRSGVFNQASVPKYGRQLGVKYYVTGKVQAADERTEDARRVQYFMFMQVIEVETSAIVWQHKAYVTKMVR